MKKQTYGENTVTEQWKSVDYISHYAKYYNTSEAEFIELANRLRLHSEDRLIDFGCGDGFFLSCCARHIKTGMGVDLSIHQVNSAREYLKDYPNIEICQSSFLEYDSHGRLFTKGFSRKALHHLTDQDKKIFFGQIGSMFVKNSLFLIEDAVFFDFRRADMENHWEELMKEAAVYYGHAWEHKQKDVAECFRLEFPTDLMTWTAALEAGGFAVIETRRACSFYGSILAQKR